VKQRLTFPALADPLRVVSWTLLLVVAVGCDQLGAKTQAVAVLTRTPDLAQATDLPPELESALPLASLVQSSATSVGLALGERESVASSTITPVSSANVTVSWSGVTVGLCAQSTALGTYAATSLATVACGDARLAYQPASLYTFDIETAGDQYTVRVTAPPMLATSDVLLDPPLTALTNTYGVQLRRHERSTPLKLDWSHGAVNEPAFIAVFRIEYIGNGVDDAASSQSWRLPAEPNPVFENHPRSVGEYVNLVFEDTPPTSFTISREAFGAQGLYITVVTPVAVSTDVSSNLSVGSGALAGGGTALAFWVQ
jgi:hypothetical protein